MRFTRARLTIIVIIIAAIIIFSTVAYEHQGASSEIYGKTYIYQIDRYYIFNSITINFTEFQTLKFGMPTKGGLLPINVTEVEQQYTALINMTNGKIVNVFYDGNASQMLTSGQGTLENLYIAPGKFPSIGQSVTLLNYTMYALGYTYISLPSSNREKVLVLQYTNSSSSNGTSYYYRTVFYYSKSTGVLVRSSFLTRTTGITGNYYNNQTSTLYRVY
ncbi:MAG: hypothetical protein JRN53_04100 [Nitrososphaerota archaeon]|nr:hypothetical protein [Nitrososphaerota archaeon]MDG7046756.1 hypothetical protein [Nitrososphaerota archaeon]